ncbi:exocyst complex component 3-like protein 2 [Hemicordylus capensis]|uniref:exocyst complex component 3-like protein 2 n=1 Tax=Hemicordylus capensis TaxID=884348 RepID=UPI0023040017|nr:exocyst complex component 3-like protein 2 [Hemicordylus capensis]XP_053123258.1 exocyst complex component 3-like protein 2 [Hemicordylus capensis]XP_053123259.1 exocyst complex component 3-like protein 2 [Hemicordylus capensis]XP_053123260.1 exocyst complex component 3-like protein 2 [Hemicordylus capensis]XP_053123261.1 exocyst complex component 3-like protein 2 [Hemicordylus capensis]XP_053123262.1 exocyst complex component 3-like protein 2 [Hemicordylus capensis]XP_053123263.1 exocyst 
MPVLKHPYQLKMANGEAASSGALILEKEGQGTNPFEEDLEGNERDAFLGHASPESRNPSPEGGGALERGLFSGSLEGHYRRRATLEKLVGLPHFRLGRGKKGGDKDRPPSGERGSDRRSFLGRMLIPLSEGNQRAAEKRKAPRRRSEDFSLLQRLNGRRKEGLCSLECGLAEKENGGGDAVKRMAFLKIGLGGRVRRASLVEKLSPTEASEPEPAAEEGQVKAKEPLSVLEILNLIQQRDLLTADEHIIELEAECEQDGLPGPESGEARKDGSRKAKDVALLYKELLKELWAVLAESLAAKGASLPLELVVQVIEQEEATDRRWLEAKGGPAQAGARPRAMRMQWAEAVARVVSQRLGQCVEGRAGPIATLMDRLAKCAVEDLCTVKFHLLHAYPKEYKAFGVYLGSYHRGLAQHLAQEVQKKLTIPELYFVLDWNSNIYQREVLRRAEIASLVKGQELGQLLSPETQQRLEENCLVAVKAKITADMMQELQKEEESWAQDAKGQDAQPGLSSKVISVLKVHADKAPQITEDFGMRMAHCCLSSLAEFLQSFQEKVERFHEDQAQPSPVDGCMGCTIMLVNCCPPFRDYAERLARFGHPESEAATRQANSCLRRVTRLCNSVLADQLFHNLKPYFHKLMKWKWLSNSEAFSTIMVLLSEHVQKLNTMKLEPYQMLVKEVHRRVLIEYIRPLMRVRIICVSSKMRAKMANKLRDEARQLQEFFTQLESTPSWLDSAVPRLAGIIELEETPAIQVEVGFLAKEFPDVQKKHVSAILDVRGLQNQAQRQDILAAVESLEAPEGEAQLCQDQAFFSEIPTSEVFCARVRLRRLSLWGHTCLSRLRLRPRQRRQRQRRHPKESEAESWV